MESRRWLAALLLAIPLAACGGENDDDRILEFPSGARTVREWRAQFRSIIIDSPTAERTCDRLDGLSDREIMETFLAAADFPISQLDDIPDDDIDRAGEIVREECRRIT